MLHTLLTLAQEDSSNNAGGAAAGIMAMMGGCFFMVVALVMALIIIVGLWKVFVKAGQPGWTALIPILNVFVLVRIAGKEWWWIILFFIPVVSIIAAIMVALALAEKFGKSAAFGIGMAFLPFIFYPILGFGKAQYQGPPVAKLF